MLFDIAFDIYKIIIVARCDSNKTVLLYELSLIYHSFFIIIYIILLLIL